MTTMNWAGIVIGSVILAGIVALLVIKKTRNLTLNALLERKSLFTTIIILSAMIAGYLQLVAPASLQHSAALVTAACWLGAGYAVGQYNRSKPGIEGQASQQQPPPKV
jgi:F0F1-type ATP synthase membrane subunit c/vacuolar-type H+-ATPase subunit K